MGDGEVPFSQIDGQVADSPASEEVAGFGNALGKGILVAVQPGMARFAR